jgi:hypothetical protein
MLVWLQAVCDLVLHDQEFGPADVPIAMPFGVVYTANQFLVTQMGPRSREWAEAVAGDPMKGKVFFSWWNPERDAGYYLNRAACLMWTAVRWRNPLVDSERQILNEVNENLQLAYRLNEALDYPWREWNEILKYLDADVKAPGGLENAPPRPLIGYRRNRVRISLAAGWTIQIPGRFAEAWEDNTWCGWDRDLTVWVTAFKGDGSAREILSEFQPDSDDIVTHEIEGILGRGSVGWVEEDGQRYWRLHARSADDGRFCLCTICYAASSERNLALEIWQSLTA